MKKIVLSLSLVLLFLGSSLSTALAGEANLTRHLADYERMAGPPNIYTDSFFGLTGEGMLIVLNGKESNPNTMVKSASISINGDQILGPNDFKNMNRIEAPVDLLAGDIFRRKYQKGNTITVEMNGKVGGCLTVRVTQYTEADLGVTGYVYFGINTSDIFVQQDFYRTLGIEGEIFPAGPETSMTYAQSLGFVGNYWIFVELRSLEAPPSPPYIDTVEFRGFAHNPEPPYANLNNIGMAYVTFSTTDLDGDYAYLMSEGVEFVSPPTTAPNGERFVFLKDQDGTYFKLIQEGDVSDSGGPDLVRMVNTNINVADLERSREFYRLLGLTEEEDGSQAGSGDFAAAHGFDDPIEFEGVDVSVPLPGGDPDVALQLRQWKTPFNSEPAYGGPVNHLGIDRVHFRVTDLIAAINTMNELGFEQLGPIGGSSGAGGIVFFYDPDGIKLEFSGPIDEGGPPPLP
jgi:catechol 2,3-dioxygenase-like lactoylglutathione lyase family enzyme